MHNYLCYEIRYTYKDIYIFSSHPKFFLNDIGHIAKAFYSSRPGSAWDFTKVRLIFMNDSFIKCVSSILKY